MKKIFSYFSATVLIAFGLLTLFLSTSVIFDLFGIRAKQGNYVLFIVWANLISSLLFLAAAYGFARAQKWTTILLGISASILSIALIGFIFYISAGGIYETKTIGAMIFRIPFTLVFAAIAYFLFSRKGKTIN
ncbi:MAG: hypothetical protein PHS59_15445 [Paludibacter sp.]|nr:hypothetical protein [Paludibacter sp.]